jgi:predicted kinase
MKKVIVVCGLPGSGKSTLAESLAEKLALPIFSVDPIESSIIKSGLQRSFETGLAAYLVAETLAGEQLKRGMSVIIDAVSGVQEARDMWHALSDKHDARLVIIECILDRDIHKQRIEARVRNMHGIPEVTWNNVENRRKEYLDWEEERLILDTSDHKENNLVKALDYIKATELEKA